MFNNQRLADTERHGPMPVRLAGTSLAGWSLLLGTQEHNGLVEPLGRLGRMAVLLSFLRVVRLHFLDHTRIPALPPWPQLLLSHFPHQTRVPYRLRLPRCLVQPA